MANEAYRAVFLRVHPTGKMVLSLTTEPDGHEGEYAHQVAGEFGIPALDVKVVPGDLDRFGEDHGFNTSPSDGTSAAVAAATEKILSKARLLAGMALDAPPDALRWGDGMFSAGEDDERARSIADVAMYAHGTGALPPGVEGGLDAQTVYRD
ncbi:MAG TPA: molybdopterin cofactor-binding domain-containing protein [Solirubrobacteraceae bacterium]|jgi:carbon-monoxide dehydrogenase large subunit|nr:molybdopterin cofactor-binding domain-containing protein [Solirubrobacteraceae bacterium]